MSSAAPRESHITGRMIAGGILILLGVLFTLDNFGLVRAGDLFRYWPLLLVGVGLLKIAQARYSEGRVAGAILTAAGILLLLRTLHVLWFHMRDVWPVFLVIAGVLLVWRAAHGSGPVSAAGDALAGARESVAGARVEGADGGAVYMNDFAFLGGGERIVRSQDFRGGEITAIMGGFNIDLRGAGIAGDEAVLEIFTLWGGVELRVPEEWQVVLHGVPILGGFSETSRGAVRAMPGAAGPAKRLVIKGTAIMGGVEVKR